MPQHKCQVRKNCNLAKSSTHIDAMFGATGAQDRDQIEDLGGGDEIASQSAMKSQTWVAAMKSPAYDVRRTLQIMLKVTD